MRKYAAILLLVFAFSCKNQTENKIAELNDDKEKVIECIIMDDSLNILRSDSTAIPLSKELKKLKVYSLNKNDENRPPKPENGIYLEDLFHYDLDVNFIPEKDSLYILHQNETLNTYAIENTFPKKST